MGALLDPHTRIVLPKGDGNMTSDIWVLTPEALPWNRPRSISQLLGPSRRSCGNRRSGITNRRPNVKSSKG